MQSVVSERKGDTPNYDKQGCYALFAGNDLLYVGVGAARNNSYPGHGLGSRINHCIRRTERADREAGLHADYVPKAKWAECEMTMIKTIGFPAEFAYLAYALEAFSLERLTPPPYNSVKSGAVPLAR